MSTITQEQQAAIVAALARMDNLPIGVGTAENACSIAAINLALTGKLTDRIPDCMSEVIGKWIIKIQDAMPASMRNSARWRDLLPLAAGTGRGAERKLADHVVSWMWCDVLPKLQSVADVGGFGAEWLAMTTQKTAKAAHAHATAADSAAASAAAYAAKHVAAYAANAATYAANAAANAATYAANAAANAAAYAASSAATDAADFWESIDTCGCLEQMINLTKESP